MKTPSQWVNGLGNRTSRIDFVSEPKSIKEWVSAIQQETRADALASQWQTIESAPKDGTYFLAIQYTMKGMCHFPSVVSYDGESFYWECEHKISSSIPTHWMPLPQPPQPLMKRDRL